MKYKIYLLTFAIILMAAQSNAGVLSAFGRVVVKTLSKVAKGVGKAGKALKTFVKAVKEPIQKGAQYIQQTGLVTDITDSVKNMFLAADRDFGPSVISDFAKAFIDTNAYSMLKKGTQMFAVLSDKGIVRAMELAGKPIMRKFLNTVEDAWDEKKKISPAAKYYPEIQKIVTSNNVGVTVMDMVRNNKVDRKLSEKILTQAFYHQRVTSNEEKNKEIAIQVRKEAEDVVNLSLRAWDEVDSFATSEEDFRAMIDNVKKDDSDRKYHGGQKSHDKRRKEAIAIQNDEREEIEKPQFQPEQMSLSDSIFYGVMNIFTGHDEEFKRGQVAMIEGLQTLQNTCDEIVTEATNGFKAIADKLQDFAKDAENAVLIRCSLDHLNILVDKIYGLQKQMTRFYAVIQEKSIKKPMRQFEYVDWALQVVGLHYLNLNNKLDQINDLLFPPEKPTLWSAKSGTGGIVSFFGNKFQEDRCKIMGSGLNNDGEVGKNMKTPQQYIRFDILPWVQKLELDGLIMVEFAHEILKANKIENMTIPLRLSRIRFIERWNRINRLLVDGIRDLDRNVWRTDLVNPNLTLEARFVNMLESYLGSEEQTGDKNSWYNCDAKEYKKDNKEATCTGHGKLYDYYLICPWPNVCDACKLDVEKHGYEYAWVKTLTPEGYIKLDDKGAHAKLKEDNKCEDGHIQEHISTTNILLRRREHCYGICDPGEDDSVKSTRRYVSLQEQVADSGFVVVGVHFTMIRRILYIQILQHKLEGNGVVNETHGGGWKEIPKNDVVDLSPGDYHRLDYNNREMIINSVIDHSNNGKVVTGVKFQMKGRRLQLAVRFTEYGFENGTLGESSWDSTSDSGYKEDQGCGPFQEKRRKGLSLGATMHVYRDTTIQFSAGEYGDGIVRAIAPYFDLQDVYAYPYAPLSGVGLIHRRYGEYEKEHIECDETNGVGFIQPEIHTIDYSMMEDLKMNDDIVQ